jgi:hypothetical protein
METFSFVLQKRNFDIQHEINLLDLEKRKFIATSFSDNEISKEINELRVHEFNIKIRLKQLEIAQNLKLNQATSNKTEIKVHDSDGSITVSFENITKLADGSSVLKDKDGINYLVANNLRN